jgi:hypothetical protein
MKVNHDFLRLRPVTKNLFLKEVPLSMSFRD